MSINEDFIKYMLDTEQSQITSEKIKLYLQKGANIDCLIGQKTPLLIYFTQKGKQQIINLLLENGANINIKNYDGCTAIITASSLENNKIAKSLLSKNEIDVNATDNEGYNALLYAVLHEDKETLELLLKNKNININYMYEIKKNENTYKFTALHFLAMKNHKEMMDILKAHGADVSIKNQAGLTADELYKVKIKPNRHNDHPSSPSTAPSSLSNKDLESQKTWKSHGIISALVPTSIIGLSSFVKDSLPIIISTSWDKLSMITQPIVDIALYITNFINKAVDASQVGTTSASNFIQDSFRSALPIAIAVAAAQAVIKFIESYGENKTITESIVESAYQGGSSLTQSGSAAVGGALCAGIATSVGMVGAVSVALPIFGAFTAAYTTRKATDYIKSSIGM